MTPPRADTVLVTGAAGFLGGHLLAHLRASPDGPRRIVAADVRRGPDDRAEWTACDLTDAGAVASLLAVAPPQVIIHLAGVTGGTDLHAYFVVNVLAAENLLSASAALPRPPRIVVVGTAAMYGVTTGGHEVVDETRPLLGQTPYGVSKILQEAWALAYTRAGRVPVVCARPFNLMGPGQPASLVPAAFMSQIIDVLEGRAAEVRVGNTWPRRDFIDVRDVAAALWALATADDRAVGQVFNVASGQAVSVAEMLQACMDLAGRNIPVRQDPARVRAGDVPVIVGDATRLRSLTGWQPRVSWRQSLRDMWDGLRGRGGA